MRTTESTGEKVRVFIGTEPKTEIARRVLETSIHRRTNCDVVCTPMIGKDWEYDIGTIPVGTGFSLRRWMIAEACNWQGRAIYLDADQVVLADIWDLWTKPDQLAYTPGTSAWMSFQADKYSPKKPWPQTSVMVIDCAAAQHQWGWYIGKVLDHLRKHPNKKAYADVMHGTWMTPQPVRIEDAWNHLNVFHDGKTKLLHYTREPDQPWYNPDHPHAAVWQKELQVALDRNIVKPDEIRAAIGKFGKTEDWRTTNGIHPDYGRFLEQYEKAKRGPKPK